MRNDTTKPEPGTIRRFAILQDTINRVDDPTPWPVRWWAMDGDDIWTAGTADTAYIDPYGIYEPGDLVIHRHTIDGDAARKTDALTLPAGMENVARRLPGLIADRNHGRLPELHAVVRNPGHERIGLPGTGMPLETGWRRAVERAMERPDADPDDIRLALLEHGLDQGRAASAAPRAWFLETNGYDLVVIDWHRDRSGDFDRFALRHLQYQNDMRPTLETIAHSAQHEYLRHPERMDANTLMEKSRSLYDEYQRGRNEDNGPESWGMPHPIARMGLAGPTDRPLLETPNGRIEEWDAMIDRTACLAALVPDESARAGRPAVPRDEAAAATHTAGTYTRWPSLSVPKRNVRPYTRRLRDGREWNKMIATLPAGTTAAGRPVGGWNIDMSMNDDNLRRWNAGEPIILRFNPERHVELFHGAGRARRAITIPDPATLHAPRPDEPANPRNAGNGRNPEPDGDMPRPDPTRTATAADPARPGPAPATA